MNSDHKKKMSNIIDFRKKPVSSPKFFSQTQQYWDELEDKRILIDAMMEDAAKELQQRGYNPEDFIVDRNAMYYFLGEPLWETYTDEPEEGPGFVAFQENDIIYLQVYIMVDPENAYMAFQLFRLPDYERGNRAWLIFDQESETWKKGPGKDFFELEDLLELKPGERQGD